MVADGFAAHLSAKGCAPFPVGPRIPRKDGALPPLAAPLSLNRRSACAFDVMNEELAIVEARAEGDGAQSNNKGRLWRHVRSAIGEWFQRHGDDSNGPRPASALLDEMYRLARRRNNNADAEYHRRIRSLPCRPFEAGRPDAFAPFCSPHYACCCGTRLELLSRTHLTESTDQLDEMRRVLEDSQGEWRLLSGMFLSLVHGHLAILPNRQYTKKSRRYEGVLRALDAIVGSEHAAHAERVVPVAASLHLQLEELTPFLVSKDHERAWTLDFDRLPPCFNPFRFARDVSAAEQARRLLEECGSNHAADWVEVVADLAREVASLLTDPLIAPDLGFTRDELESLYGRYVSDQKKHKALADNPTAFGDPAELVAIVTARFPVLRSFTDWMCVRGLELVVAARRTEPVEGEAR